MIDTINGKVVVPLAEDESSGLFRYSKCEKVAPDAAPLGNINVSERP